MKKLLSLIIFICLIYNVGSSTTNRLITREMELNEAYYKIASGYLVLEETERSYYYIDKITDQNMRENFYFTEFKYFLEKGELERAIEYIKNFTLVDTTKKKLSSWSISKNNRENAIKMVVDHYWHNGEEKLAFDFANKYDNEAAFSKLCSNSSRKYLDKKDYDNAIKYAEIITFVYDKDNMISQISIDLMYEHYWDRGLELCQRISSNERREETYFTITNKLIKAGFLDRMPEFISLIKSVQYHDELRLSAIGWSMKCHFYAAAILYAEEVKQDYKKKQAYNQILLGYLENGDLGKASAFISNYEEILTGKSALKKYVKECCLAGKFTEAMRITDSMKNSSDRDNAYSTIIEYSLKDEDIKRVEYIVDELLTFYPLSSYEHICKYYCSKDDLQKAASYAEKLKPDDQKDEIYKIITLHCLEEKNFNKAIEFANLISNNLIKQSMIFKIEREIKYLEQEKMK